MKAIGSGENVPRRLEHPEAERGFGNGRDFGGDFGIFLLKAAFRAISGW